MTNVEFTYWQAYYGLNPFGEERADLRAAMTTAKIHNVNVTKKADLVTIADCMPNFGDSTETKQQTNIDNARAKFASMAMELERQS